jgi:hypothetical protein
MSIASLDSLSYCGLAQTFKLIPSKPTETKHVALQDDACLCGLPLGYVNNT